MACSVRVKVVWNEAKNLAVLVVWTEQDEGTLRIISARGNAT